MRSSIAGSGRPRGLRLSVVAVLLVCGALPMVVGCGTSQEELMMRAARRSRPTNSSEEEDQQKEVNEAAKNRKGKAKDANRQKSNQTAALVPERETNEKLKEATADIAQKAEESIKPIEERRKELEDGGRAMVAGNLEKIATALLRYHEDYELFPRSHSLTRSKIPSLSWRVEILPYLGYEELYKKFDWQVPWNREPNKSLLKYIPDEFVSPDRWDTKTNLMFPASEGFIAADNKGRAHHQIEDGPDNTILLIEVADELAVPWTQPRDYHRVNTSIREDLKMRGDGVFGIWANGWTVMLASELTDKQFNNAMTIEAGDGQVAGMVHRDIPLKSPSAASKVAEKKDAGL